MTTKKKSYKVDVNGLIASALGLGAACVLAYLGQVELAEDRALGLGRGALAPAAWRVHHEDVNERRFRRQSGWWVVSTLNFLRTRTLVFAYRLTLVVAILAWVFGLLSGCGPSRATHGARRSQSHGGRVPNERRRHRQERAEHQRGRAPARSSSRFGALRRAARTALPITSIARASA